MLSFFCQKELSDKIWRGWGQCDWESSFAVMKDLTKLSEAALWVTLVGGHSSKFCNFDFADVDFQILVSPGSRFDQDVDHSVSNIIERNPWRVLNFHRLVLRAPIDFLLNSFFNRSAMQSILTPPNFIGQLLLAKEMGAVYFIPSKSKDLRVWAYLLRGNFWQWIERHISFETLLSIN